MPTFDDDKISRQEVYFSWNLGEPGTTAGWTSDAVLYPRFGHPEHRRRTLAATIKLSIASSSR